jgi:ElaB/YqjD/DUF883 family membrane-anchored ribosome-binding protein
MNTATPSKTTESERFARKAGATVESLQDDLQALRDDMSKLTQQMVGLASAKGTEVYSRAKKKLDEKGQEAADAMREVRDSFTEAIEESLKERPYTTLALAVGLGFIFGAIWRR